DVQGGIAKKREHAVAFRPPQLQGGVDNHIAAESPERIGNGNSSLCASGHTEDGKVQGRIASRIGLCRGALGAAFEYKSTPFDPEEFSRIHPTAERQAHAGKS